MFSEPHPEVVLPNPGGADDPLGESVLDAELPGQRCFEPDTVRIVIGRHQDPWREVDCAAAARDGVPIHRRLSGGGAVVLAPGMLVLALRMAPGTVDPACWFAHVNRALIPAVAAVIGRRPAAHRLGDLTLDDAAGRRRKILGASLRQNARMAVYLGVFLVADATPLMAAYLRSPSREPDYRDGRSHADFCTHLGAYGATVPRLRTALSAHLPLLARTAPTCALPTAVASGTP